VAVGEAEAAPQEQRVVEAVGRDGPRLREGRARALGLAVDVDEVGLQPSDDLARTSRRPRSPGSGSWARSAARRRGGPRTAGLRGRCGGPRAGGRLLGGRGHGQQQGRHRQDSPHRLPPGWASGLRETRVRRETAALPTTPSMRGRPGPGQGRAPTSTNTRRARDSAGARPACFPSSAPALPLRARGTRG
jgi:hypothetical protein